MNSGPPGLLRVGHACRAAILALIMAVGPVGCSGAPQTPGVLLSPASVPGSWMMDQRITAFQGDKKGQAFRAVAQKQGNTLLVVGMTPMGTRAFVIEQRGPDVQFERQGDDIQLPFPPEMMLHDVQRTFLKRLFEETPADGVYKGSIAGESVTETWEDGRLTERTFARPDTDGVVYIHFGVGLDDGTPGTVTLRNEWFGYRLSIETLTLRTLD